MHNFFHGSNNIIILLLRDDDFPHVRDRSRRASATGRVARATRSMLVSRRPRPLDAAHTMQPCGKTHRQRGWGGLLQSADLACSSCALAIRDAPRQLCDSAGVLILRYSDSRPRTVLPHPAPAPGDGNCRVQTARGVLVSRDHGTPVAAPGVALRRSPPPAMMEGDCGARTARSMLVSVASGGTQCCVCHTYHTMSKK